MEIKKLLAIGIILLFIGVAVAPSINSSVVKASDDLVDVTSQACGIQEIGNNIVKLTKQQYRNLEHYLVDFRARLNQTTTREEAVPIFKDAVVELNKYGLLPKGMSVVRAQKLVIGDYQNPMLVRCINKMFNSSGRNYSDYENYNCLIAGHTTNTISLGPLLTSAQFVLWNGESLAYKLYVYFLRHNHMLLSNFFDLMDNLFFYVAVLFNVVSAISNFNPLLLLSIIGIGVAVNTLFYGFKDSPGIGWIFSIGKNGVKNWTDGMYGNLNENLKNPIYISWFPFLESYPGILGFFGIKIVLPNLSSFYFGSAFKVKIMTA